MEPLRRLTGMVYLGIDPGKSGGIAAIYEDLKIPPLTQKLDVPDIDVVNFLRLFDPVKVKAVMEAVHSTPQMGVVSAFTFGRSSGFLEGALTGVGIAYDKVSPQRWQKSLDCRTGGDKNITKALAQKLFPTVRVTHAIADALLLAVYSSRT